MEEEKGSLVSRIAREGSVGGLVTEGWPNKFLLGRTQTKQKIKVIVICCEELRTTSQRSESRFGTILFFFLILFIYLLFLAVLGHCCCARAFSSCGEQGLLFVVVGGLLIAVASLVAEHGLQAHRLQQLWLAGSRAQAQQLWCAGLVAPRHVGSSRIRARTHVPYIGRRIPNHCTTREIPRFGIILN